MSVHPERSRAATDEDGAALVRVRYFAGARAAAGASEERVRVTASGTGPTAADVIDAVVASHDDRLAQVVAASSFLLNGVAVRDRSVEVTDGCEFDVLPPFAGG